MNYNFWKTLNEYSTSPLWLFPCIDLVHRLLRQFFRRLQKRTLVMRGIHLLSNLLVVVHLKGCSEWFEVQLVHHLLRVVVHRCLNAHWVLLHDISIWQFLFSRLLIKYISGVEGWEMLALSNCWNWSLTLGRVVSLLHSLVIFNGSHSWIVVISIKGS